MSDGTIVAGTETTEILLTAQGFYARCARGCAWVSGIEHAKFRAVAAGEAHDAKHAAADLGRQHGADGGPPLASLYLGEDEHLWPALGITSAVTEENAPERERILMAYCDAFDRAAERARAAS